MVGPGTGVAPYRAFMQQRLAHGHPGRSWLFFGEWHRATDYYYEAFWEELVRRNVLTITTAFSRDQQRKVYVQHRLCDEGSAVVRWILDGAYLYVCGDAKVMARDVEETLLFLLQRHASMTELAAKEYLKKMRQDKRYLRDVY